MPIHHCFDIFLFFFETLTLWSSRSGSLQKKSLRKLYQGFSTTARGCGVLTTSYLGTGLPRVTFCLVTILFLLFSLVWSEILVVDSFFSSSFSRVFLLSIAVSCILYPIIFLRSVVVLDSCSPFGILRVPFDAYLFRSTKVIVGSFACSCCFSYFSMNILLIPFANMKFSSLAAFYSSFSLSFYSSI